MRNVCAVAVCLLAGAAVISGAGSPPSERPREFWTAIVANDFAVPAGERAFDLLMEMNTLLASPDPVLRDDVVYGATARWAYRKRLLTAAEQTRLVNRLVENLSTGIDSGRPDTSYLRSFSALNLSVLAALDHEAPFGTGAGAGIDAMFTRGPTLRVRVRF